MKSLILLVLAVVAAQAAVIDTIGTIEYHYPTEAEIEATESPESRALARTNVNAGNTAGQILFYRVNISRAAVAGQVVTLDVTYRVNAPASIRVAQAFQLTPLGSHARIIAGGVGVSSRSVTIRVTSARGRGIHYQFAFWGQRF